jgi:subtilisin family serine protease
MWTSHTALAASRLPPGKPQRDREGLSQRFLESRSKMWIYLAHWVVAVALMLSGCAAPDRRTQPLSDVPKQLQSRQIIVTLADASPEQWAVAAKALSEDYRLREVGNFPLRSIRVQCIVYQITEDRSLESVVEQLRRDPRVESVQTNQVFAGVQAGHSDPYATLEYGAAAIRADRAHRVSTGKGVRVAVIDTGMDKDHPDLRGRIIKVANFVEGGEKSFAQDLHGTAVAGIIGARANDGVGIFGIAPDAGLLGAKACWYPKAKNATALCSSWTLAKALDYAITSDSQVINMSLSGPVDPLLERLLHKASDSGIIVVAAAAQDADSPGFPAVMDAVTAVVASNAKGEVHVPVWAKDKILLAAPGIEILTTAPRESYDFLSGSSLAAAHVTGVIALLLEHRPELTRREIGALLTATARPVAIPVGTTVAVVGVVDACAALGKLLGQSHCF